MVSRAPFGRCSIVLIPWPLTRWCPPDVYGLLEPWLWIGFETVNVLGVYVSHSGNHFELSVTNPPVSFLCMGKAFAFPNALQCDVL